MKGIRPLITIIVGTVNFTCLIFGLLNPNAVTPFAVLPSLVASCSWIFVAASNKHKKVSILHIAIILFACFIASACVILGTCCDIDASVIRFKDVTAFKESSFPYLWFALIVFLAHLIFFIFGCWSTDNTQSERIVCFDKGADEVIKS